MAVAALRQLARVQRVYRSALGAVSRYEPVGSQAVLTMKAPGCSILAVSVKEIQSAIQALPPTEYAELQNWWERYQEQLWDEKLARDSGPQGRLRSILREVDADIDNGNVTSFPR